MKYDPIKKSLGAVFNKQPFLRKLFYRMLDLLLLRSWHIRKELNKWQKTVNAESVILDAGAGFGQYTYRLSRMNQNWKIKGVDVKQEQIDDCNQFFKSIGSDKNIHFEFADLTVFTEESKYDLVLTVDVMEHILEDEKVFENFNKSLKPGGMVLISTPSDKGGSDVHDEDEHSFIDEHVRDGYGIEDITAKLQRTGFKNIEAYYSYGKPGQVSWKLSMKYPILLLNFSKIFFLVIPFYYVLTFPFCLLMNWLDVRGKHVTGTGLIVKGYK